MRQPDGYSPEAIQGLAHTDLNNDGRVVLSRPEASNAMYPWYWRFLLAWDVLRGKGDVIYWDE